MAHINGVGYTVNNPFYTCPANTYAKIIIHNFICGGTSLWFGEIPGNQYNPSYLWGTQINFGSQTNPTGQFSVLNINNAEDNENGMIKPVEIYLAAGHRLFRDGGAANLTSMLVYTVFEYAIP